MQVGHAVLIALGYNRAVEGGVLALVNANGVFPQPAKVGSGYPVAVLEHARRRRRSSTARSRHLAA